MLWKCIIQLLELKLFKQAVIGELEKFDKVLKEQVSPVIRRIPRMPALVFTAFFP